ncbi:MAG: sulfotransferase [Myxococcota bacterium]
MRLLYVLGTSFSGSSILNALMARHPDVLALNELVNLGRELRAPWDGNRRHPLRQPFWCEVKEAFEAMGGRFDQLRLEWGWKHAALGGRRARARWAREHRNLFRALGHVSNASVFLDSSKSARRLERLMQSGYAPRVVHIVRDGRSVCASGLKRGFSFAFMLRGVQLDWLRSEMFRRRMTPERFMRLRFCDLVSNPREELERICRHVGLEYHAEQLEVHRPVEHPVAIGAKGFWMLKRGLVVQPPQRARLLGSHEMLYRAGGGPLRDVSLGLQHPRGAGEGTT